VNLFKSIVVLVWSIVFITNLAAAEVADRIVAVVNKEIITLSEFNKMFEPYAKNIEENYKGKDKEAYTKQARSMFLQRYIDNMLIEQEAKKTSGAIVIKDEEVMTVINQTLAKKNSSMDDFLKSLAREGKSLESVKKEIKDQLTRMRLLRREVQSKIIVSDEEIGDYYNKNRQDYEGKEAVRISKISLSLPDKANKATKAKVKNEANKIRKRIVAGEPFALIAAKYSQGPEASRGGDIGFVERGVIIPELESVAFSLPVGKLSEVIETNSGFHIIIVVDKRGAGLKPIDIVREEIKAKIEEEKLEKKYDEWITSIRKKSYIEIKL
jgi:peptidyl-prolyl cis-trans isomerase SurA